jgi:hypothetical protein
MHKLEENYNATNSFPFTKCTDNSYSVASIDVSYKQIRSDWHAVSRTHTSCTYAEEQKIELVLAVNILAHLVTAAVLLLRSCHASLLLMNGSVADCNTVHSDLGQDSDFIFVRGAEPTISFQL